MNEQERATRGRARERRRRRQERSRVMARPRSAPRQLTSSSAPQMPRLSLPRNQFIYLIPLGMILMIAVFVGLGLLKNEPPPAQPNAIWLHSEWSYGERSENDMTALVANLREHRVGAIYAFVASLRQDGTWSGADDRPNGLAQTEDTIKAFIRQWKEAYPESRLYGWVEIRADLDADGYRLDNPSVIQNTVNLAQRLIGDFGFDGVMLDIKPIWTDNEDLLDLVRAVRARIGLDVPLAVAVPADLTPQNAGLDNPPQIAPNTAWSAAYKQRLALQADQLVITAYPSYRDNVEEYQKWVAYQITSYTAALAEQGLSAQLLMSVPNYAQQLPAHNPAVENIPTALNGINRALSDLGETVPLAGVALFSDRDLSPTDWAIFRTQWLERE